MCNIQSNSQIRSFSTIELSVLSRSQLLVHGFVFKKVKLRALQRDHILTFQTLRGFNTVRYLYTLVVCQVLSVRNSRQESFSYLHYYNSSESSTYQPIGDDFSIQYLSGSVDGQTSRDTVFWGDVSAENMVSSRYSTFKHRIELDPLIDTHQLSPHTLHLHNPQLTPHQHTSTAPSTSTHTPLHHTTTPLPSQHHITTP